jgi:hypothetical protein
MYLINQSDFRVDSLSKFTADKFPIMCLSYSTYHLKCALLGEIT